MDLHREELLFPFLLLTLPVLPILLIGIVRGKLAPAVGLLAIIVLPVSSFTLGNLVLMQRAKSADFCGSCHEMVPVIRSARAGGDDLAALHFRAPFPRREGCYTCHSGYGIWGDMNAKLDGVSHLWVSLTNSAHYPLQHSGRFDEAGCLKCHAGADAFAAVAAHSDPGVQTAIASGALACSGSCHPPAHDPRSLVESDRRG